MLCITAVHSSTLLPHCGRVPNRVHPRVGKDGRLEESYGLAHGRLDVQGLDILPVLLQQRDEEVDG